MIDYLYDETFEGLLTCIYQHYYDEKAAGIYPERCYQASILRAYKTVETDENKAKIVYEAIESKISTVDLRRIYRVFRSSDENKETKILKYVLLGFKVGPKVSLLHSETLVFDVQQIEHKVSFEIHRLFGLIRFSVIKPNQAIGSADKNVEILYCTVEPDHDVLEFLADHFTDRFKNEPFIIHDKKREKALFSQNGDWYISPFRHGDLLKKTEDEALYQTLWKHYFQTIAIEERINPRCQKRCMPVRYWKNLMEFN